MNDIVDPQQSPEDAEGMPRRLVVKAALVGSAAAGLSVGRLSTADADQRKQNTVKTHNKNAVKPRPRTAIAACTPGTTTDANIEGPYFEPGSPAQANVGAGVTGVALVLTGTVSDPNCQPIANALLDFWQCDSTGTYDNTGYTLRGHQFSGPDGSYSLTTIVPASYSDDSGTRTPHIHVKVQAPNGPILTTQLFFPDDTQAYGLDFAALNAQDQLFDPQCSITEQQDANGGYAGQFDFVITTA